MLGGRLSPNWELPNMPVKIIPKNRKWLSPTNLTFWKQSMSKNLLPVNLISKKNSDLWDDSFQITKYLEETSSKDSKLILEQSQDSIIVSVIFSPYKLLHRGESWNRTFKRKIESPPLKISVSNRSKQHKVSSTYLSVSKKHGKWQS